MSAIFSQRVTPRIRLLFAAFVGICMLQCFPPPQAQAAGLSITPQTQEVTYGEGKTLTYTLPRSASLIRKSMWYRNSESITLTSYGLSATANKTTLTVVVSETTPTGTYGFRFRFLPNRYSNYGYLIVKPRGEVLTITPSVSVTVGENITDTQPDSVQAATGLYNGDTVIIESIAPADLNVQTNTDGVVTQTPGVYAYNVNASVIKVFNNISGVSRDMTNGYSNISYERGTITVKKADPAVTLTEGVHQADSGTQRIIPLTATVEGKTGVSNPSGTVTFYADSDGTVTVIGIAVLDSDGKASVQWTADANKTWEVYASYAGDDNYLAKGSIAIDINTSLLPQSFAIEPLEDATYGDIIELHISTAGEGTGEVSYSSDKPSVARIIQEDGVYKALACGEGEAVITANKKADSFYNEAGSAHTLTVHRRAITVTAADADMTAGDDLPSFAWTITGGSLAAASGDAFSAAPILFCADDTAVAGSYAILVEDAVIQNSNGEDVTANYIITYVPGTLTVRAAPASDTQDAAELPETSDRANPVLYALLAIVAFAGICIALGRSRTHI